MREFQYCFTMDDIAMADYATEAHFERTLDLCRELELKATFFVLPRSGGADLRQKPGYIDLIHRAIAEGHEIAQHGLDHDRFECGIPPKMILDLPHEGPTREYLANHRDELAARHTVPALQKMLREGRQIIEEATGIHPVGFRAPSAAMCENLHPALLASDYLYDSSVMMQSGAWDLLNGVYTSPAPINRDVFDAAGAETDLTVIPGAGEYTWYLDESRYAVTLELAKHDFHKSLEADIPFVSVAHVSPMWQTAALGESSLGATFYRELIAYCRQHLAVEGIAMKSVTLQDVAQKIQNQKNGKTFASSGV